MNHTAQNILQCGVNDRTRLALSEYVIFRVGCREKIDSCTRMNAYFLLNMYLRNGILGRR